MQTVDVQKLIEKNPKVDGVKVEEIRGAVRELRKLGVVRPQQYSLTSPYSKPGRLKAYTKKP